MAALLLAMSDMIPPPVSAVIRERPDMKLVHFINLLSATDDCWNEAKEAPAPLQERTVSIAIDGELEAVLLASPDTENGRTIPLDYTIVATPRGHAL